MAADAMCIFVHTVYCLDKTDTQGVKFSDSDCRVYNLTGP